MKIRHSFPAAVLGLTLCLSACRVDGFGISYRFGPADIWGHHWHHHPALSWHDSLFPSHYYCNSQLNSPHSHDVALQDPWSDQYFDELFHDDFFTNPCWPWQCKHQTDTDDEHSDVDTNKFVNNELPKEAVQHDESQHQHKCGCSKRQTGENQRLLNKKYEQKLRNQERESQKQHLERQRQEKLHQEQLMKIQEEERQERMRREEERRNEMRRQEEWRNEQRRQHEQWKQEQNRLRRQNDDKSQILSLQVNGYFPNELHVRTSNGKLHIHGVHRCGCDESCAIKEFERSYNIPANVDTASISATLDSDGMLIISGNKYRYAVEQFDTKIHVQGLGIPQSNTHVDCNAKKVKPAGIRLQKIDKRTGKPYQPENFDFENSDNFPVFEEEENDDGVTVEIVE